MATITSSSCIETKLIMDRVLKDVAGPAIGYNVFNSGVLNAVRDSLNYPGVSSVDTQALQTLPDADGKPCRFQVWYDTPSCGESPECDDTETMCPTEINKDGSKKCATPIMGPCIKDGFSQAVEDYQCVVDGQTEHYIKNLRNTYDRMKRAVNSRYRDQLIANLGTYMTLTAGAEEDSATNPRNVYYPTNYDSTNKWVGFLPISTDYNAAGLGMTKYVVGGSAVSNYNIQSGIKGQTGSIEPFNVFYDPQIDTSLGSDRLISFIPGTITPLWWTDSKPGKPKWDSAMKTRDAFDLGAVFGEPGFWVERIIQLHDCDEKFTYSFRLWTDLFTIPDDAYSKVDCLQRSNLILQWIASCAVYDCNDLISGGVIPPETT